MKYSRGGQPGAGYGGDPERVDWYRASLVFCICARPVYGVPQSSEQKRTLSRADSQVVAVTGMM